MRILQVIHDFLPKHQAGSELYCYQISRTLVERGHQVCLFFAEIDHDRPDYSYRTGTVLGLPFWEVVNHHAYRTFEETYSNPSIESVFARCLDEFQPQVVHVHHLLGLSYGCIDLCKKRKIPVVMTLHDYWLTCPRGGGQRFRGGGAVCHEVDPSLCAECISRYRFPGIHWAQRLKRVLTVFKPELDATLLTRMQNGRIRTKQPSFVTRDRIEIDGESHEVIGAHPPSVISVRVHIPAKARLSFAVAMGPSTYEQSGDGVQFIIRCDGQTVYDRTLLPKQHRSDRGWHFETVALDRFSGKRKVEFETRAVPSGNIDFCSAFWAEPRLLTESGSAYQPPVSSFLQSMSEAWLGALHRQRLVQQVEKRALATRRLFQQVDLFIAPSRFLRTKMIEYGMDPDRIVYSDYGIADQGYRANDRTPVHPIRFTFIGTLVEHKGLHVLIEAFNRVPHDKAVLDVFGDTCEFTGYVARIQHLINHPRIELKGRIENDQIPAVLAQTDVLVVPSIWFENSPITIHEAFLARVPVITSRFGGMADLVEHGKNGLLFELGDPDSLYEQLMRCIDSPARILALRPDPMSVKSVRDDTDWLLGVYQDLAKRPVAV